MTHPQVLSDEQIDILQAEHDCFGDCDAPRIHDLARAIESATLEAVRGQVPVVVRVLDRNDKRMVPGISDEQRSMINAAYTHPSPTQPPAQAERAPVDERARFERWIKVGGGDLSTFGTGENIHYHNSAVNNAWTGWQARAALKGQEQADEIARLKRKISNLEEGLSAYHRLLTDQEQAQQPSLGAPCGIAGMLKTTCPYCEQGFAFECQTCGGHGLVGGHMKDGSGDGEGCPDCNLKQATAAVPEAMGDEQIEDLTALFKDAMDWGRSYGQRLNLSDITVADVSEGYAQKARAILALRTAGAVPDGWVPLRIEYEPGYPEDVAFGPQRMMDRLKKWLDRYFEMLTAAPPAPKDGRDAERWRLATDDKRIEGPAVCAWRWDGVDEVYQYRRLTRSEAEALIDAAMSAAQAEREKGTP